jgi:hypothetical protein
MTAGNNHFRKLDAIFHHKFVLPGLFLVLKKQARAANAHQGGGQSPR